MKQIRITDKAGIISDANKANCNKPNCNCQIEIDNPIKTKKGASVGGNLHLFVGDIVLSGTDSQVLNKDTDIWVSDEVANNLIELGWGEEV